MAKLTALDKPKRFMKLPEEAPMANLHRRFYDFGSSRLVEKEGVLLREGEPLSLTPKAFDTLVVLVQNNPRVVAKEELIRAVWPESAVEENNLTQQVSVLRKILGAGQSGQQYIETIPKRGYRSWHPLKKVGKRPYRLQNRHRSPRLSRPRGRLPSPEEIPIWKRFHPPGKS